jgi:hypothetical protein
MTLRFGSNAATADPLDTWTLRRESVQPQLSSPITSLAFGNNIWVGIGGGELMTASDPGSMNWTGRGSRGENVVFANGFFVAVGRAGSILTSADGVMWTVQPTGTTDDLNAVTFGKGLFVAVGRSGVILTSPDARNWTTQKLSEPLVSFTDIAHGNGQFVALSYAKILTSSDGIAWAVRSEPAWGVLSAVTYDKGLFVILAVAGILTSQDAVTWTQRNAGLPYPLYLSDVTSFNGNFIAVGGTPSLPAAAIVTSSDGITWTQQISPIATPLFAVAAGPGQVVAAGGGSHGPARLPNAVLISTNGILWRDKGNAVSLQSVAFAQDLFVAVGSNGTILTSSDGTDWQEQESSTGAQLNGVASDGRTFVVVGNDGTIMTSENGVAWAQRQSGIKDRLNAVSFGNGLFSAVGGEPASPLGPVHPILTSSNAVNWTLRDERNSAGPLYGVAYGNGRSVAIGGLATEFQPEVRTIVTSDDGVTWLGKDEPPWGVLRGIAFGQELFVSVGDHSTINTSTDGRIWSRKSPVGYEVSFFDVGYAQGSFVVVGLAGRILTSSDAQSWVTRTSGSTRNLNGIAYGRGTFVAVGESGTILQSSSFPLLQPSLRDGVFQAAIPTSNGNAYRLQFKNSLQETNWSDLSVVQGDGSVKLLKDPAPPLMPQRFYRLRVD